MEVALGAKKALGYWWQQESSLNPCFCGSCSWSRGRRYGNVPVALCLNPYFSGSCSWRILKLTIVYCWNVLILILVEVALGVRKNVSGVIKLSNGLNPYFSGSCSWRNHTGLFELRETMS